MTRYYLNFPELSYTPEQLVALLVCVGLHLHQRVIVLDEFEQL